MIYENVGQIIEGQQLRSIAGNRSIYDACAVLDEFNIGALPVMQDGALIGIISERDVIRRVVMRGRDFVQTTVAEVMTPDPKVIDASAGPAEALNTMIIGHFRHLPVAKNGSVVGMLSIRNIPVEVWYMKRRYEEIMATPVIVAETAVDQHHRADLSNDPA